MLTSDTTTAPGDTQAMALMPDFLSAAQKRRLAAIRKGRLLWKNDLRQFLIGDGRTAHLYKALMDASGNERPLLVAIGIVGLAAKKTADLLMLNPPEFAAPEEFPDPSFDKLHMGMPFIHQIPK